MKKTSKKNNVLSVDIFSVRKRLLTLVLTMFIAFFSMEAYAKVKVDGTAAQRNQIAKWLTSSLGTKVTVAADGTMAIANGGNKSAARLRNMINDAGTSVTLKVVENDPKVFLGQWKSSNANRKGPTTGTQEIDVGDLKKLGNVINSYGATPDWVLMHEVTEVYEGKKGNLNYEDAHKKGIAAEKELMGEHGTSYPGPRVIKIGTGYYMKIKRPAGSKPPYVLIKLDISKHDFEWFKETVPCNTSSVLIPIPDPDPQVHIFTYDSNLEHYISQTIDKENSVPVGVAYDADGNLYVLENLETGGEIRVFNLEGELINTIKREELITPEGIDIDKTTGDIFVAVEGSVVRYSKDGEFMGNYFVEMPGFTPTDVAVWRNTSIRGIYGDGSEYDIYVTDRTSGQVYRFDVNEHMNSGNFKAVFGEGLLNAPEGIHIDSWWSVWVMSTGNNGIYRFAPNGELEPFGDRAYFVEDPERIFNDAIMIDFDGLYVVDGTQGKGELLLYDFDGNLKKTYGTGTLQCPASIAVHFIVDESNMESIPDPGTEEEEIEGGEEGFSWLTLIAVMVLLAIIFFFAARRKSR